MNSTISRLLVNEVRDAVVDAKITPDYLYIKEQPGWRIKYAILTRKKRKAIHGSPQEMEKFIKLNGLECQGGCVIIYAEQQGEIIEIIRRRLEGDPSWT